LAQIGEQPVGTIDDVEGLAELILRIVHRSHLPIQPPQVLRLEGGVAQHARQTGGKQPPRAR
jgi:hypothetical protein